jgi:hypothetical protein
METDRSRDRHRVSVLGLELGFEFGVLEAAREQGLEVRSRHGWNRVLASLSSDFGVAEHQCRAVEKMKV